MHVVSGTALKRSLGHHVVGHVRTVVTLAQGVVAGELHHVHVLLKLGLWLDHDCLRAYLAFVVVDADASISYINVVLLAGNRLARPLLSVTIFLVYLHGGRAIQRVFLFSHNLVNASEALEIITVVHLHFFF